MAGFKLYLPPALVKPRVRLYAMGHGVSVLGGWIQQVALSVLIYRLTNSVFLLGVSGFVQMIPFLLLGPFAGQLVDRLPRFKLLIAIDLALAASAVTLGLLAANGVTDVRVFLFIAGFNGVLNALEMPTRQALLGEIVDDRSLMPSALALSATLFNAGRMIGPAIAGALLYVLPEFFCFFLNAATYAAIIIALLQMRLPPRPAAAKGSNAPQGIFSSIAYLTSLTQVRFLLPIVIAVGLFAAPYVHLMPSIAETFFAGRSGTVGVLMSCSGLGALFAAGFLSMQRTSVMQVRALAIAPAALGIALMLFSATRYLPLGMLVMTVLGASVVVCANSTNILLQQSVPDAWRGRVIGLYAMAFQGTAPLGNLLAGAVASQIGLGPTLLMNGAIIFAVALFTRWRFRQHPEILRALFRGQPMAATR